MRITWLSLDGVAAIKGGPDGITSVSRRFSSGALDDSSFRAFGDSSNCASGTDSETMGGCDKGVGAGTCIDDGGKGGLRADGGAVRRRSGSRGTRRSEAMGILLCLRDSSLPAAYHHNHHSYRSRTGAEERICLICDARTKTPWLAGHEKYRWPWTHPSFLPVGVSNSTPTHLPVAKAVLPT